ncbi:tetratricopeptide repeat protein [Synechococcus sp. PCC 6312]|uniref:tetratricopeptide repeat protein n=1 Tax=Synechococcus sp. (strain ATCC 27167 / PCC 6312) TaxID=195253 RepID=UPI00029EC391|nr:tetratricopeptide repeat protein [Synechococcus sp. PCC 6312]AFY62077.1 tetratricopeptide repeat protein [Synechococcus sp. PCC 6312]
MPRPCISVSVARLGSLFFVAGISIWPLSIAQAQVLIPHTPQLSATDMERDGLTVAQEALQLAQFQQFNEALIRAKLAAQLAPQAYEVWALLGGLYLTVSQPAEAIPALNTSIALNQKNAGVYFSLGSAYFRTGAYQDAARALEQGLALRSDVAEEWFNLGNAYLKLNQNPKAIAQYRQALKSDKKFWPALNNIGLLQYEQGDIPQAIRSFQAAVALDNKAGEPKLALAVGLFRQGQVQQGINTALVALRLDSRYIEPDFQRENLWGERLMADTKALFANPQVQELIQTLQADVGQ